MVDSRAYRSADREEGWDHFCTSITSVLSLGTQGIGHFVLSSLPAISSWLHASPPAPPFLSLFLKKYMSLALESQLCLANAFLYRTFAVTKGATTSS